MHGLCSNHSTLISFLPLYSDPSLCRCPFPLCKRFLNTVRQKHYSLCGKTILKIRYCYLGCIKALALDSRQRLSTYYGVTCQARVLPPVLTHTTSQLALSLPQQLFYGFIVIKEIALWCIYS